MKTTTFTAYLPVLFVPWLVSCASLEAPDDSDTGSLKKNHCQRTARLLAESLPESAALRLWCGSCGSACTRRPGSR